MAEKFALFLHVVVTIIKLLKPGGTNSIIAESIILKHQLIVINRGRKRAPKLTTFDRSIFGILAFLIKKSRLAKVSIVVRPATILKFHKHLVNKKYQKLFSSTMTKAPGRKAPKPSIIELVIEMKKRNPDFGYGRISMQIYVAYGIEISRYSVGRILSKVGIHSHPSRQGPSWLTFLSQSKDSLWSLDLFRCESATLKSHWVMVVLDVFTRRIVGFSVHSGNCNPAANCRMFNQIVKNKSTPQYLSTDNDPNFQPHRWRANLRILDIEEIKSTPGEPTSHPFIERVIGTCRREFLDKQLFWNARDLQKKLNQFQDYYNSRRSHSSIDRLTPAEKAKDITKIKPGTEDASKSRWQSYCNGLYHLPEAA